MKQELFITSKQLTVAYLIALIINSFFFGSIAFIVTGALGIGFWVGRKFERYGEDIPESIQSSYSKTIVITEEDQRSPEAIAQKKLAKKQMKEEKRLTKVMPKKQRKSEYDNFNYEITTDQLQRLRQRIVEAIRAGEILHIKYWGGSTPGECREISPIKFTETGLLRATCLRDGEAKSFKLEKIEFDELEEAA
jgi:hypothetical protein